MKKICIFCGKSAPEVKMSNEHVIRSFLSNHLPSPPTATTWEQTYVNPDDGSLISRVRKIPKSPLQITVNDICKTCNEGWLNLKVEQPIENQLEALIKGLPITITDEISLKISTWAAKTAMVRARQDLEPYPIPQSHHEHLMVNLTPPDGTYVWLGFTQYEPNTYIRQYKFNVSVEDSPLERGHLTTIVIGHMGLFVLGCEGAICKEMAQPAIEYISSHDLLRLYPNGNTSIWPGSMPISIIQAKTISSAMAELTSILGNGS